MHYFRCLEILNTMKETAERGVLGSLKGHAGKWEKLVKAYESSMLHVAEGGLILSRNVDYELPYLQKQTAKYRQQIEDLEKKSEELLKGAAATHDHFVSECRRMGVPEESVQDAASLDAALLLSADSLLADIESFCRYLRSNDVESMISYYRSFIGEHHMMHTPGPLLLVLQQVLLGETEDFEEEEMRSSWISIADISSEYILDETSNSVNGRENSAEVQEIEIAWDGLDVADDGAGFAPDIDAQPIDVDWDIDVSGVGESNIPIDIKMADHEVSAGSQQLDVHAAVSGLLSSLKEKSKEARRLTLDATFRNAVLDAVLELKAFVYQRVRELKTSSTAFSDTKEDTMDLKAAETMLDALSHAAAMLTSEEITNKIAIITSKAHRDRVGRKLLAIYLKEKKQIAESHEADKKKEEIQRALVSDSAKHSALVRETRQIKEAVEIALGAKIKRNINIQGSIHNVLKSAA